MLFFKRKKQNQDLDVDAPAFGLPTQPGPTGNVLGGQDIGSPIGQSGAGPLNMSAQTQNSPTKPIDIMRDPGLTTQAPLGPTAAAAPASADSSTGAGDLGAGTLTSYTQQYDVGGTMVTPPAVEDTPPKTETAAAAPAAPVASTIAGQYDVGGTMVTPPAVEDTPPKTETAAAAPAAPVASTIAGQYDVGGTMVTPPAGPALSSKPQPDLDPATDYLAAHHPSHMSID